MLIRIEKKLTQGGSNQKPSINVVKMELSKSKMMIILLTFLMQSVMGVGFSLTSLFASGQGAYLMLGEDSFYYYFSVTGFVINIIVLCSSFIFLSIETANILLTRGVSRRRRLLYEAAEQRTYGAFGYYSIV